MKIKGFVVENKEKIYGLLKGKKIEDESVIEKIKFACEIGLLLNGELNTMFNVKIAML